MHRLNSKRNCLNTSFCAYPAGFKSGFVAITGAPNAGKSTLLNRILGQKISITSRKPQTTRNRILGILHRPCAQIVFMDTPGVHPAKNPLNKRIVEVALSVLDDADMVLLVADALTSNPLSEQLIVDNLKKKTKPILLALNKIDRLKKSDLLAAMAVWSNLCDFGAVVPISALHGDQIEILVKEMEARLPIGPPMFPEDALTDSPERFIAAEIIREKVFRFTGQEIPYSTAVTVDSFVEDENSRRISIHAAIHLERDSQKGIVIGKGGLKLKKIGEEARKEIERLVGGKVFLKLFVRIQKNWSKDAEALRRFGY
jgi:GTPase